VALTALQEITLGIGHFAVGLALKKAEPRINLGPLVFAAYLTDLLFGTFVLLGLEQYHVPPDVATKHYLTFTFPYSHGLLATLVWASLAGLIACRLTNGMSFQRSATWLVVAAVCSHFVLDAVVHIPEIPVIGEDSYKIGLGLWNHLFLGLGLEVVLVAAGLAIYWDCTRARSAVGRFGMPALLISFTALMVATQATMTSAPPPGWLIAGWILLPMVFSGLAFWLDCHRVPADAVVTV
jgi:hypothetical protein